MVAARRSSRGRRDHADHPARHARAHGRERDLGPRTQYAGRAPDPPGRERTRWRASSASRQWRRKATRPNSAACACAHEARLQLQPGTSAVPEAVLDRMPRRALRLAGARHVGDGDQPSRQRISRRSSSAPRRGCVSCSAFRRAIASCLSPAGRPCSSRPCPCNLAGSGTAVADYVVTGHWGKKAVTEAERYCTRERCCRRGRDEYMSIPPSRELGACAATPPTCTTRPNETIGGVNSISCPTRARCRSSPTCPRRSLSRPIDVSRFGVIYAGAQKNLGHLRHHRRHRPRRPARPRAARDAGRHRLHARRPPTSRCSTRLRPSCGTCSRSRLDWVAEQGGVRVMAERKSAKASAAVSRPSTRRASTSNPVDPPASLVDERAVHACRPRIWTRRFSPRRRRAGLANLEGPPRRSAACARASTTRCRKQASRR